MALAAYRNILRSTRFAFQGDIRLLEASRTEARSKFDLNRILPPDTPQTQQKILEAAQVATILRQNIVQGRRVEGKEGGVEGEGEGQEQRYQLRIHSETERGDNDSVKSGLGAGAGLVDSGGVGCCGGGGSR